MARCFPYAGEWTFNVSDDTRKNILFSRKAERVGSLLNRGVILEVRNPHEARMAEEAGVKGVLVTEGLLILGVTPEHDRIEDVALAVRIPVIASVQFGHTNEAQILENYRLLGLIEETKALHLGPSDPFINYINKHDFNLPFVCECGDFQEALRCVLAGATLIRIQGNERYPGDIVDTVRRVRKMREQFNDLKIMDDHTLAMQAAVLGVPCDMLKQLKELDRPPVLCFAAGGISTPADAALMIELGCDGVFVTYDVVWDDNMLKAMVEAVENANILEPEQDEIWG